MKIFKPVFLVAVAAFTMISACKKDENTLPKEKPKEEETLATVTISTIDISGITETSAISGGNISVIGKTTIKEAGVCWSTEANPTIFNYFQTDAAVAGEYSDNGKVFEITLTDLEPDTRYYLRAYVKHGDAVVYGNELSFETGLVDKEQFWSYFDTVRTTNLFVNYDRDNRTLFFVDYNNSGNLGLIQFFGGLEYPKTYTIVNVEDSLLVDQVKMTSVLYSKHWVGKGNNGTVLKTHVVDDKIYIDFENIILQSVTDTTVTKNSSARLVLRL